MKLSDATREAPMEMGWYKIFYNNELKYIGHAESGLRNRFRELYNGTTVEEELLLSASTSEKIFEHRDNIRVTWEVCNSLEQCRESILEYVKEECVRGDITKLFSGFW